MKLLFYARSGDGIGDEIQRLIEARAPGIRIEACRTSDALSQRLRQPADGLAIALIVAASQEEFQKVIELRSLLNDLRIILILPERKKETIIQGLTLRPRFLTFADADLTDVIAVLNKMCRVYSDEFARWKSGVRIENREATQG